jgi:WD40 repeat protein
MMSAKKGTRGPARRRKPAVAKIIRAANASWHLLGIIMFALMMSTASPAPADEAAPLQLLHAVALPGFSGDFDHFAVDEKGGRLFLAAEDHKTVEVFDVKTTKRLKSIEGFGTPHSIISLPETDRILVADGDKGALQVLRGTDYTVVDHVDGLAGADSMKLDAPAQIVYVVTGGKDVPLDHSFLVAIDLKTLTKLSELRIESNHVEAFALESSSSRLFVNITDRHEVAVVDRKAMKEIARWPIGSQADNSPMAYDEQHHRLLIVCRNPGTLLVMDADSGKVVARLPAAERSDDIAFNAASGRIYVPGGDGRIKKADEDDLRVIETGKPNLEVNKKGDHFEVELVLQDQSGKTIGAVGIVFMYEKGKDVEFQKKAEQVRDEMRQKTPTLAKLFEPAD